MFDSAVMCDGTVSEHVNVAFRSGSSQHGRHLRAVVAQKKVDAIVAGLPWRSVYVLR